ncbi:MAG: sigma 54-interacting transcriptional regulator [Veillonellales bacterium]
MPKNQHVVTVGIVSPFDTFTRQARLLAGTIPNIKLEIYEAALEKSRDIVSKLTDRRVDVVVSRGATAEYLKPYTQLPVVSCNITFYDLALACRKAKQYGSKIAIILFGSSDFDIPFLSELLGIQIVHIPSYTNSLEIKRGIDSSVAQGYKVIVGSALAVSYAEKMGIPGLVVESSSQSIQDAIAVAAHLARVRRAEREQAEKMRVILDFAYSGVIAVDAQGRIEVFNETARKIIGVTRDCIGRNIEQVVPNTRLPEVVNKNEPQIGEIQRISATTSILTSRVPLLVEGEVIGAVATFNEATHIQRWEQKLRKELIGKGLVAKKTFDDICRCSAPLKEAVEKAKQFAASDLPVLIYGETGTGKEGFAQSIHNASSRSSGPFVAINCSALPETLLESELFGYEEGAFSGARRGGKHGLFELAHGGTIFLDEIGSISVSLQSRLLRVLQEKEVMRVGSDRIIPVDFRLITATNVDLAGQLREGKFRSDLYFRINVLRLPLPALRQCPEDISYLAGVFLERAGLNTEEILTPAAFSRLQQYSWPGNIRELESFCRRLAILSKSQSTEEILDEFTNELQPPSTAPELTKSDIILTIGPWQEMEREIFHQVVRHFGNNRTLAAKIMEISRSTLWKKMK